jgi:C-terminal processing protease CtpA/Prc
MRCSQKQQKLTNPKKLILDMKNYKWTVWVLLPFLAMTVSCSEDDVLTDQEIAAQEQVQAQASLKTAVLEIMQEWYLWSDEIPADVKIEDYEDADALMDGLKNKQFDKWSYIEPEDDYRSFFEKGEYEGYGLRMAFDLERKLRVAFVYSDSPFGKAGIRRSWIINKINGKTVASLMEGNSLSQALEGNSHTFELIRPDGSVVTESLTKGTIGINTVLNTALMQLPNAKVGYLAFNSFLATSEEELSEAFTQFQSEGIDELILDLRYNGGGRVNIAEWMASNIIGNAGSGRNFIEYSFNTQKAEEYNERIPFNAPTIPLNLDRLIVITSRGSASASELLINGLRPFIDVTLVGDDTYGKPVGSFPFFHEGYAISPISFKIVNDQGMGEYYNGLLADVYVEDDLAHELGNPEESRLKEALYYIENGTFSGTTARELNKIKEQQIEMEGFRQEIGAY